MVEFSWPQGWEPRGTSLEVFHGGKTFWSSGLDFSSSSVGRSREGWEDRRHWRENVRNVPGASTYPRRGQRNGAGRGEGRGARLPAARENLFVLLFSGGRSPVRGSSFPCALPSAPCSPRPLTRPGWVQRCPPEGARAPRPPDPLPITQAGYLYQVGLLSRCLKEVARPPGGNKEYPVCVLLDTNQGLSFPTDNSYSLQASLLGFLSGRQYPRFLLFTTSEETGNVP